MISPLIETPFVDNKSICFDIRLGAVIQGSAGTYRGLLYSAQT